MIVAFTVYGVAAPKGSMRARLIKGVPLVTDSNKSVRGWQQLVAHGASDALHQLPPEDRHIITGGVRCTVVFHLPRPKRLQAARYRGTPLQHTTKPDVDKLTRGVLDALKGVLYTDDACVVSLAVVKKYADIGAPPRADVRVETADGPPPLSVAEAREHFTLELVDR